MSVASRAMPPTGTEDVATAAETPEQPDEAAQADLDRVAEHDPAAPPDLSGEIPPEGEVAAEPVAEPASATAVADRHR